MSMLNNFSAPTVVGGPCPGIKTVSFCWERIFCCMFLMSVFSENLFVDEPIFPADITSPVKITLPTL